MKFEVWAQTDVGLKREINQDSILVDHDMHLYVVADGMGGHKGGEVASSMAIETVQEYLRARFNEFRVQPKKILADAYHEASLRIHHRSNVEAPDLMGMGTTMVGLIGLNNKVYIANVGDSRAYLYREGQLWQITEDHSLINEQVKAGVISESDAQSVAGRNVITRSVGFESDVQVDVFERQLQADDCFLLCSDGLTGLVNNERIADILRNNSLRDAVDKCITEAKKAGGDDNVSVVLIRARPA